MKKIVYLMLVAMAVAVLSSCGGSSDKPEAVAQKFLNHLAKKEFAEAKKMATTESSAAIDMLETLVKTDESDAKEKKIENLSCKEDGDKATCKYDEDGESKTLDMVKKDGKWLVEMKKESSPDSDSDTTTDSDNVSGTSDDNTSDANADKKADEEVSGSSDCDQFIKDYEAFATSYIKVLKKYKANPTDMTVLGEYTEMAQKAAKMDKEAKDCNDAVYVSKIAAIASKIASAAAGL